MIRKVVTGLAIIAVIGLTIVAFLFLNGPSEEDKQADFLQRLNSQEAQEIMTRLYNDFEGLVFDGKHEGPSFIAKLTGVNIKEKVSAPVRPIYTDLIFRMPLKEFFVSTGAVEALNNKRASEAALAAKEGALKGGATEEEANKKAQEAYASQEPLRIEDAMGKFREDVLGMFPPQFVQMMSISPDDVLTMPGWPLIGLGALEAPPASGFLAPEHVGASLAVYGRVCYSVPEEFAENFIATVTMRANPETEDSWKLETLFAGTAKELCAERLTGEYPKLYQDEEIIVFRRPNTKVFPAPRVVLGSVQDLMAGGNLYLPSVGSGGVEVITATFESLQESSLVRSNIVILLDKGSHLEAGAPIFYIKSEREEPVRLVGFMNITGSYALSSVYILANMPEFSNIVSIDSK